MEKKKPLVLVVMDGVGWSESDNCNVVKHAYIPNLQELAQGERFCTLRAHGKAVGLPSEDDMGNSEVGHNALGCGQIYAQGAMLVNQSLASGAIFNSPTWQELVASVRPGHCLHLLGLLSDGNVHSHIDHVKALLQAAKTAGIRRVALHMLTDGRDVGAQTALNYVDEIEAYMSSLNTADFKAFCASGGGRMLLTMDRYEADWQMVERGWQTHVLGQAEGFSSTRAAIEHFREQDPGISDQFLPPWVVTENGQAIAPIVDGDAVILFNFRGDRALEISRAFTEGSSFKAFDRQRVPQVFFAGMLEYDGDLHIPPHYLVAPPQINHTLSEQLIAAGLKQYAVSETQKFGHMTYFWNGNRSEKFSAELEDFAEIPSDIISFDLKPWMKAYEITEAVIAALASGQYDFLRCNFPNGDMVGHTGNYQAALVALETVDLALGRLKEAVDKYGAQMLIVADHGNCDEMCQPRKSPEAPLVIKTAHTLAPVPCILYGNEAWRMKKDGDFGLANIARTVCELLEVAAHPLWLPSVIEQV